MGLFWRDLGLEVGRREGIVSGRGRNGGRDGVELDVIGFRVRELMKTLFVTGTDTGVGKTVLAALLLRHLRRRGFRALAMKPFCSGGRGDVQVLQRLQAGELADDEMNPWHYAEPVSPWTAQRARGERVTAKMALERICLVKRRCDLLIIEGAGGLLAPLGEELTALDLIRKMRCGVMVVAADRLGCINHTLLTVGALERAGVRRWVVVMMGQRRADESSATNREFLEKKLGAKRIFWLPYLGDNVLGISELQKKENFLQKTLARLLEFDKSLGVLSKRKTAGKKEKKSC